MELRGKKSPRQSISERKSADKQPGHQHDVGAEEGGAGGCGGRRCRGSHILLPAVALAGCSLAGREGWGASNFKTVFLFHRCRGGATGGHWRVFNFLLVCEGAVSSVIELNTCSKLLSIDSFDLPRDSGIQKSALRLWPLAAGAADAPPPAFKS